MKKQLGFIGRLAVITALGLGLASVGVTPAFAATTGTLTFQLDGMQSAPVTAGPLDNVRLYYKHNGVIAYENILFLNGTAPLQITNVPAGHSLTAVVTVAAPHLSITKTGIEASAGQTKAIVLHTPLAAAISGTVTRSGSPVTGAAVALVAGGKVWDFTDTDSQGKYQLYVPSGTYRLEFNSHVGNPAETLDWAWSYWKSAASWSKAKTITVTQETKTRAETQLGNIDGTVIRAGYILADVDLTGVTGSNEVDIVSSHPTENFSTQLLSGGGGFAAWLAPGTYKIGIWGPFDHVLKTQTIYWYRGEGKGPTASESLATWVTVGTTEKDITFIDNPTPF